MITPFYFSFFFFSFFLNFYISLNKNFIHFHISSERPKNMKEKQIWAITRKSNKAKPHYYWNAFVRNTKCNIKIQTTYILRQSHIFLFMIQYKASPDYFWGQTRSSPEYTTFYSSCFTDSAMSMIIVRQSEGS